MKIRDFLKEEDMNKYNPTREMFRFFEQRTKDHINRVKACGYRLSQHLDNMEDMENLLNRVEKHDESKYSEEEMIPYVWLSWYYKLKANGIDFKYPSNDIRKKINKAAKHHIEANLHHPEAHQSPSDMTLIDLAEMVCDWQAMSEEMNNSLRDWAKKVVNVKWKFDDWQTKLIWDFVDFFENRG